MRIAPCLGLALLLGCAAGAAGAHGTPQSRDTAKPPFVLKRVAKGLRQPLYVTAAPSEAGRLHIVLRPGTV